MIPGQLQVVIFFGRKGENLQVLSSSSETSLNFIDDEEDTVLIADLSQSFEVTLRCGDVSSLTEDGFEDESGGVSRSGLLLEEKLEAVEGLFDEFVVRGGVRNTELMPVRVRSSENTGLKKRKVPSQLFVKDKKERMKRTMRGANPSP